MLQTEHLADLGWLSYPEVCELENEPGCSGKSVFGHLGNSEAELIDRQTHGVGNVHPVDPGIDV